MNSHQLFIRSRYLLGGVLACLLALFIPQSRADVDISNLPLFLGGNGLPLSLLVMGRDHKLYYEAYNDASDLNQDGEIDVGYKPDLQQDGQPLDYFGYFDSYKCYEYTGSGTGGKFTPIADTDTVVSGNTTTKTKKCTSVDAWSGDFLNYLTTARIDAVRRVLYGGYRVEDEDDATVLERARVPQDAHSWGKEYKSVEDDGFDISEYSPLGVPPAGTRHLFANTTLLCPNNNDPACTTFAGTGLPLLRILDNSLFRVWEWLSIERPVAGHQCVSGTGGSRVNCETAGSPDTTHPNSNAEFTALLSTFAVPERQQGTTSSPGTPSRIRCVDNNCNPNGSDDNYITVIEGSLNITTAGDYFFAVNGDDAVEVLINGQPVSGWYGGHAWCDDGGESSNVPNNQTQFDACANATSNNLVSGGVSINLPVGIYPIKFHHEEVAGNDSYILYWRREGSATSWRSVPSTNFRVSGNGTLVRSTYNRIVNPSVMTNHVVRVDACVNDDDFRLEPECKAYQLGDDDEDTVVYKPTGILHDYGETDRMAFGLLSGSYSRHLSGGVLRKNMSSFANEVDPDTGVFIKDDPEGSIVDTVDKIQVVGFRGSYAYADGGCGVPMVTPMQTGRCRMWGNPVAEMMYEGLRYFANAGASSPFSNFSQPEYTGTGGVSDPTLTLPVPTWKDPYRTNPIDDDDPGGYNWCSKPFEIVIADAPSFDTDQLPGKDSTFNITSGVTALTNTLTGINVATHGLTIWNGEFDENTPSPAFIGQSGSVYDTAPTPKDVTSFGNIRGLAPEEPTREGGYYAASVAYHGKTTGVRTLQDVNNVDRVIRTDTFGVALSSPLPKIEIPVNYVADDPPATPEIITVVPFAKSVGGSGINAASTAFQPTNTIVDFYVEEIANTGAGNEDSSINEGRPFVKFRINYEDSEYGSDHDMDAIVTYTFIVNSDQTLTINLSSDYEAGGVLHHMGYVISGTTADGVYLEVRDANGPSGSRNPTNDIDYFLDTPPTFTGVPPAPSSGTGQWNDGVSLPVTASRTFTSGTAAAKFIPVDPLWLAAKWGGFIDVNRNNQLNGGDQEKNGEWDSNGDGKPDAYFLVTNAGKLKEQLRATFTEISKRVTSAAAVAVNTGSLSVGSRVYQARFDSTDWTGELRALSINPQTGAIEPNPKDATKPLEVWAAQNLLLDDTDREILTFNPSTGEGTAFSWPSGGNCTDPSTGLPDAALDQNQCNALNAGDGAGEARLEFVRGDIKNEEPNGLEFRNRSPSKVPPTVLGDIINSNPFYVGAPAAGYGFSGYPTFATNLNTRRPMIYIGGNDGMLHGFDANTGKEVFAYIPSVVFEKLPELTFQDYNTPAQHEYFVDGAATARDVYFGGTWHTVLVGSLRAGGYGYFALDVTNPGKVDSNGNETSASLLTQANADDVVLWEFSNIDTTDGSCDTGDLCDEDLGLTFNQPSLVRLADSNGIVGNNANDNPWVVVLSNGYNNTGSGKAALFVLNVSDGSVRRKFFYDPGTASDDHCLPDAENGLSTPSVVDINGDTLADFIYAGDLKGNLWKFDIRNATASNWTCQKLFVAQDGSGNPQPITAAPEVVLHPTKNPGTNTSDPTDDQPTLMILFGTGRYLGASDVTNTALQTFYGVWDDGETVLTALTRGDLQKQIFCPGSPADPTCEIVNAEGDTVTSAGEFTTGGRTFRVSSARSVNYVFGDATAPRGWFLDLSLNSGERVVGEPVVVGGRILFTSIQPNPDECAFGGTSWLNILDPISGARPKESFLSCCGTDTDGQLIKETETGFPPSSVEIVGIASAPNIMKAPDLPEGAKFNAYLSTSEGIVEHVSIAGSELGRQSWRQLEFQ